MDKMLTIPALISILLMGCAGNVNLSSAAKTPLNRETTLQHLKITEQISYLHYNKAKSCLDNGDKNCALIELKKAWAINPSYKNPLRLMLSIKQQEKKPAGKSASLTLKPPAQAAHSRLKVYNLEVTGADTENPLAVETPNLVSAEISYNTTSTVQTPSQYEAKPEYSAVWENETGSETTSQADKSLPQSQAPEIVVEPERMTLHQGQLVSVNILVKNVQNLFGAPFYLEYDPGILEFRSISEGEFLKMDSENTVFVYSVEKTRGRIMIGLSRLGVKTGRNGSGRLAQISFMTRKKGSTRLFLQKADLRNPQNLPITADIKNARITIE